MTVLADEPDDSTAMVWSEAEASAELESTEKAIYKLNLNDKEVLMEEVEDLLAVLYQAFKIGTHHLSHPFFLK
ncbi:MAG: hypothetical protein F3745_06655 [Nitrospinae bacterium]|nr:hypothetical protein [Nitrospinota bacterium]